MINKWIFEVDIEDERNVYNLGSVFHGAIIEQLSDEMKDYLHNSSKYSPLKQRLYNKEGKYYWEVISLQDELATELQCVFETTDSFYLKSHQKTVHLTQVAHQVISIKEFTDNIYQQEHYSKYIKVRLLTPMSFKTDGKYDIFPDLRKMYRSAMLQYDTFADKYQVYDLELLDYLQENSRFVNYKLRSTKFYLEGTKIPAFIGEFTVQILAALPVVQLGHLLLSFGEYSGVGIKTSLGMGKFEIVNR